MVHGNGGSANVWRPLERLLRARGYRATELEAVSYPRGESNEAVARRVRAAVRVVRARTGARHVDLVSHSMGALSTRWYLKTLGGARVVDAWVSLAGVNEGTLTASVCVLAPQCREMLPRSHLLGRLDTAPRLPGPTRYAAFWSPCDRLVVPRGNARLSGALNVETSCLDHGQITRDPVVLDRVAAFLRA